MDTDQTRYLPLTHVVAVYTFLGIAYGQFWNEHNAASLCKLAQDTKRLEAPRSNAMDSFRPATRRDKNAMMRSPKHLRERARDCLNSSKSVRTDADRTVLEDSAAEMIITAARIEGNQTRTVSA